LDRERIFGEKPCKHLWCLHCERAYKWGQFREIDGLQYCPYDGCDGDTVMDGWRWEEIVEANPDYPDVPVLGKVYELNRGSKSLTPEFRRFQKVSSAVGGLMFPAQAAEVLEISRQRLSDLLKEGRLRQHNFFGRDYIASDEVLRFQGVARTAGRPKKKDKK